MSFVCEAGLWNFCRFMPDYDSREELAPRDIVARAIQDQMLKSDSSHVLLDISHCDKAHVLTHFPNIAAQCAKHGIDITKEAMPVAPAAHFMCGGVQVCFILHSIAFHHQGFQH